MSFRLNLTSSAVRLAILKFLFQYSPDRFYPHVDSCLP